MAFTLKQTLSSQSGAAEKFCHDDSDYIYYLDHDGSDWHVYQLQASTNTETKISENASFSGVIDRLEDAGPVYFGGKVYILTDNAGTTFRIYEWTGSGTNWTLRDTITPTEASNDFELQVVGSQLICVYEDEKTEADGTYTVKVRYSADGTSWSNGTVDAGPSPPAATYNTWAIDCFNMQNHPNGLWLVKYVADAAIPNHFLYSLYKWNNGTNNFDYTGDFYQKDAPDFTGDSWVEDILLTDILNWYESAQQYEETTLTGTGSDPNDGSVNPIRTVGFTTKSIGYLDVGAALNFYIMDPVGTWDSGEQIGSESGGVVHGAVRFTATGDTWILMRPSSGARKIYQRDDPIADSGGGGGAGPYDLVHSLAGVPGGILVT